MKSLRTLLKVAQRRLDELGVEAAKVGQDIAELQAKQDGILAREQVEIANSSRDSMFASLLPAYRLRIRWQIDEVKAQVSAKERVLDEIRERLSEAYREKSKFEQLIEQGEQREAADRAAKEQAMLDEVAINRAGGQGK